MSALYVEGVVKQQASRPLRTGVVRQEGVCREPRRVGGDATDADADGGWWLCGDQLADAKQSGNCVAYSFGIKDDWSFDQELSRDHSCKVHGFDPSPDGLESKPAYEASSGEGGERHYHDWGLGGESKTYGPGEVPFKWPGIGYLRGVNTLPWELLTVGETMRRLGNDQLDVLKVDAEGAEFFAMKDLLASGLVREGKLSQFCLELHFDPSKYEAVTADTLSGGFRLAQTLADDVDAMGMLRELRSQGMRLWRWKFNAFDPHCIEASFVFSPAKS